MAKCVLQLQNISKYYYSETTVTQALRKINLEFQKGEFVAITGESGSGKSTLLNMISGLDTFDEGEMYFEGQPTFQFDEQDWEEYRRNQIGFVFQDYSLIGHYTALDNVLAALVIQEQDAIQSEAKAMEYLEQVGLKAFAGQRASQLSSGQKQRLSIARALAKNTDILVADEPTGNLDSETGIQIVQLLAKLSREKLVIMVTHNYDQAEPYITRKIRLHDGEVVTDVPVNRLTDGQEQVEQLQACEPSGDCKAEMELSESELSAKKGTTINRMAAFFAWRNITMQRGRAALFFSFFLVTAVVSFLFIGQLLTYADDRITKEYDTDAYLQKNDTRIVIRYPDNRDLSKEDGEKIRSVKYVQEVDLYDYANDVNYYFQEGKGYEYFYGTKEQGKEVKGVRFLTKNQFMRSATCLTKSDLAKGHLPKSRNEVVLYSRNGKLLNQEQECYFTADNAWKNGVQYHTKVKIVGLLRKKTDQVYFDYRLCQMITVGLDDYGYSLDYCYDAMYDKFHGNMQFYPVIADDLKGNEVRASANYDLPSNGFGALPDTVEAALPGNGQIHIKALNKFGELKDEYSYTEYGEIIQKASEDLVIPVQIVDNFSDQGGEILQVSEEMFHKLYDRNSTQASAYISNYSKTKAVIDTLQKMGYDAISTYQVSATNYIEEKVYQRLEVIGISVFVLLVMMFLQILLVRSILKIKKKDYEILKFMGMRQHQINRITYLEMGVHCIAAMFLAMVIMVVLRGVKVPLLVHMMPYYNLAGVVLFVLYNLILMVLTVFFFHRLLERRV